ncbi:MAG: SpoIID/LytB domain-containing protein [Actinobacteria bacterium]|nr:SpoIID/LytB domain-containing protein [Actinomycetota bacterium]
MHRSPALPSPRALLVVLTALATALVLLPARPASAVEGAPGVRPGGFRIEAAAGTTLTIPGLGAFSDTIEVLPGPGGRLQVVNEMSMDTYVEGLAEVPASWPAESLKAQAVAARTYAWYSEDRGYYLEQGLDFDICASTACQVFHGREIADTTIGRPWVEAVRATSGEVLAHEDRPILARFFSTSGGATRNNEDVFPESGPRPYLQGVDDPHDAVSPLSRWQVRFSRAQFDELLSRGETLRAAVPVAKAERVLADGTRSDHIRFTREDGHQVEIEASKFRFWVSEMAPKVFPGQYPQARADGGRMPATLPSSRIEFTLTDATVAIDGFGWGHGVGMSQFGAKGKAEDGWHYGDILSAYYTGLEAAPHPGAPERIRVGLDWENLSQVEVRADGYVRVFTADAQTDARSTIPWTFRSEGSTVDLVTAPHVTFGERTHETRRLPRDVAPPALAPAVEAAAPAEPPASDEPRSIPGERTAVLDVAPAATTDDADDATQDGAGPSVAGAISSTVQRTAPGVGGLVTLLRGAVRVLAG